MSLTKANSGVLKQTVVSKTTTYTATATDGLILCDSSGGIFTITLPAASGLTGKELVFKKTSSDVNPITIDGSGSETIDGVATKKLNTQYETLKIVCDGSNWHIVQRDFSTVPASYAASYNHSTNVSHDAYWTRLGNKIRITFSSTYSGANSDGAWTVSLPFASTLSVDTSTIAGTVVTRRLIVGQGYLFQNSSGLTYACRAIYESGTAFSLKMINDDNTTIHEEILVDSSSAPFALAASDQINGYIEVEIDGWDE